MDVAERQHWLKFDSNAQESACSESNQHADPYADTDLANAAFIG